MTEPQSSDGLTAAQAAQRLLENGPNALPASRPLCAGRLLLDVVSEPMFLLLVACGVIYLLLGDRNEALMLLGFVCIVMSITFFQRRRTERSLHALSDLSCPRALVIRDGKQERIAGRELVPGDLVLLAEGDRVPADIELLSTSNFTADGEPAGSQGQVRHSHTNSTLAVSICSKLRFIKCRYGSTDCLGRDVKSGGDMGHGKSGRQIRACHCLVSVGIAGLILRE